MLQPMGVTKNNKLIPLSPSDFNRKYTPRVSRSDVVLPSEYNAYAVCVEFAKEWFVEKFPEHTFNSIYVDGTHSFDEFRKFSDINQQMKRANPLLAIVPTIDNNHNRQWIDSNPEMPLMLQRSRVDDAFFNDIRDNRGLHLKLQFKTILMNFVFKMRLDTRAEELDMINYIKLHHRAGYTETRNLALDIHVPRAIIAQIAMDNAISVDDMGHVRDNVKMLNYLNSHSLIPFLYKFRCATGNDEYFIKVPNCVAHIKSELPTGDDGVRQEMLTTNYNIEFQIEVEMTAPYCYSYYSQSEMPFIKGAPILSSDDVIIQPHIKTDLPREIENHWPLLTYTEYEVDDEDLGKPLEIDFKEYFENTSMLRTIDYTKSIAVSPSIFLHMIIFNNGIELDYDMDWESLVLTTKENITHNRTVIGFYVDQKYINDTDIYLDALKTNPSRIV